jgi:NADH-quinone oxidoreductase subunit M
VLCVLVSWKQVTARVGAFHFFLMLMETGVLGVFLASDLFLFYLFWEVQLIPMFFLIGVWGHENRVYATVKFILYTIAGSLLMLAALIVLYLIHGTQTGQYTFSLSQLIQTRLPLATEKWLFAAFLLAFAIKVPLVPVHSWLPDAHTEAPTAGSVILAGVLLKMGVYGFLRFAIPLFPAAVVAAQPLISWLAIIGIVYGAVMCIMQADLKRLVAYSSVSHLGYVMLGIFAFNLQGLEGGVYQMLNHGVSTGGLFLVVGMIYERRHTRMIADFGGLSKVMPRLAAFFMIITLSSIALPGTNGFVGEFLILLGAFRSNMLYGVLAASGVILGAVYMLWMFQRVMFGQITKEENRRLIDLSKREAAILCSIVAFVFLMGLYPMPFFNKMNATAAGYLNDVKMKTAVIASAGGAPVKPLGAK